MTNTEAIALDVEVRSYKKVKKYESLDYYQPFTGAF